MTELAQSVRDVNGLYEQYKPLRFSLYHEYSKMLPRNHDREELVSFIDEHFIRLCYEYDASGDMDFAGYIKIMLGLRVKYSFIGKSYRDRSRVILGKNRDFKEMFDSIGGEDDFSQYSAEFLDYLFTSCKLEPLDLLIIEGILQEQATTEITRHLRTNHLDLLPRNAVTGRVSNLGIQTKIREIRELVKIKVVEWLHS